MEIVFQPKLARSVSTAVSCVHDGKDHPNRLELSPTGCGLPHDREPNLSRQHGKNKRLIVVEE